jgi:hypothetical protein
MPYWWVPMAISAASSVVQASSASKQNKQQAAWNRYNAQMQYQTDMTNIGAQTAIAGFNAKMAMMAGKMSAGVTKKMAEFNAQQTWATTLFNDALYEEELSLLWDAVDLDLAQLENQRAVERGQILAAQAASGTVMGQDSNAQVVINQRLQEEMDAFIVRHGADVQANKIARERAAGLWQGEMAVRKILYEGAMGAYAATANANLQAAGILGESAISAAAQKKSAMFRLQAGMAGADMQYNQQQTGIQANLVSGLFSAAGQGFSNFYGMKPTSGFSAFRSVDPTPYAWKQGYTQQPIRMRGDIPATTDYLLRTPGTSLM